MTSAPLRCPATWEGVGEWLGPFDLARVVERHGRDYITWNHYVASHLLVMDIAVLI